MRLLGRQIERLARVNRYSQTGNEADLNPNVANRNKGGRRKPKKNFFSDEAIEKLEQIYLTVFRLSVALVSRRA